MINVLILTACLSTDPFQVDMLQRDTAIRVKVGKPARTIDPRLCKSAQDQADYIAAVRATKIIRGNTTEYSNPRFSHLQNGTHVTRAARRGFPSDDAKRHGVTENLSLIVPGFDPWTCWCHSSGHYENIISDYPLAGFGVATGPDGVKYYCAVYGIEQ